MRKVIILWKIILVYDKNFIWIISEIIFSRVYSDSAYLLRTKIYGRREIFLVHLFRLENSFLKKLKKSLLLYQEYLFANS